LGQPLAQRLGDLPAPRLRPADKRVHLPISVHPGARQTRASAPRRIVSEILKPGT
jgi:hypothetical protein